jgi:hypothetical protein
MMLIVRDYSELESLLQTMSVEFSVSGNTLNKKLMRERPALLWTRESKTKTIHFTLSLQNRETKCLEEETGV